MFAVGVEIMKIGNDLYTFLSDNDYGPLCMFAPVLSYVYVFVSAITLNVCT